MTATLTDILPRLSKVKQENGQYKALCPCHDDHNPSLSITEKDGNVLAKCFACGAQLPDVMDALGIQREPPAGGQNRTTVQEDEYLYAGGSLKKVKYRKPDGSKYCVWYSRQGGGWVKGRKGISPGLYQSHEDLPEIVFLVEGEKDVETLKLAGYPAVSLPDGSNSKWEDSYNAVFAGKRVLILPDNDEPGKKYAQMCAGKLYGIAGAVFVLDLKRMWSDIPEKGDISDMIANMGADAAIDKILELDGMQPWTPPQTEAEAQEEAKPGIVVTSAVDLQNADLPPTVFLITDILPDGTSIISAASKIGKSWMVLDMGLCIAAGDPFMNKPTVKCGVLYLALEDSLSRLQDRMNKILGGRTPPAGFLFATEAPTLDNGLLDKLDRILNQFPETKLIIIDTLQKIRGRALPRESSYEQDYREMGEVKSHMDKNGVSVLFVHHNRKMKDEDDPFNMISGTNGIMGAADTIWAIIKGKRSDNEATLTVLRAQPQLSAMRVLLIPRLCSRRISL